MEKQIYVASWVDDCGIAQQQTFESLADAIALANAMATNYNIDVSIA